MMTWHELIVATTKNLKMPIIAIGRLVNISLSENQNTRQRAAGRIGVLELVDWSTLFGRRSPCSQL